MVVDGNFDLCLNLHNKVNVTRICFLAVVSNNEITIIKEHLKSCYCRVCCSN